MDSKDFIELQDSYKLIYSESKKDESPEKEEEDRKKSNDEIKKVIEHSHRILAKDHIRKYLDNK